MRADPKLQAQAFRGLGFLAAVLALFIFGASGTVRYPEAWVFLGVFTGASLAITLDLIARDPELLARRVQAGPLGEKRLHQKLVQAVASIAFLAVIAVPALDRRFGWSHVPALGVVLGNGLVAIGFLFVYRVFRENRYASAIIEKAQEQTVIDTGPYALVRHPMYSSALLLILGVPLALGSLYGLVAVLPLAASIVFRLLDEEAFLSKNLPGYDDYRRRVRYRLIPGIF